MLRDLLRLQVVVCACAIAAQAAAQTTYDVSLKQSGVADSTEYPLLPFDHGAVMATSVWEAPVTIDPGSPFRGLHGTCFGLTEFKGEEIVSGGGFCTYEDADGDRYVTSWTDKDSAGGSGSTGEWAAVGGTGKFEGVTGSGTYRTGRIAGDLRTQTLTGKITLRD